MIDVEKIVKEWKLDIRERITDRDVGLTIIQVGDNQASNSYIKGKILDCEEVGVASKLIKLSKDVDYMSVIDIINEEISSTDHSIMVQLPLPYNDKCVREILDCIPLDRDADKLSQEAINDGLLPCTPLGIMHMIDEIEYDIMGKHVLIINRSEIIGKPLAKEILSRNATVTVAHSYTNKQDLVKLCKNADVIITAVGKPDFITKDMVNKDTFIIDVGINRDENGKLCGDCSRELYGYVDLITRVPKGVGLLTRCALLENII